jgi:2-keto-4-pentenoate hydratase
MRIDRLATTLSLSGAVLLAFGFGTAFAACPEDAAVAAMAEAILAGAPAEPVAVESIEDGLCAQEKLVGILSGEWGEPVGYKAGLTSEAAQENFGVPHPVRGVLMQGMMLRDGATLPASFGALPRFEADLIVVVGDEGINEATTPRDVLEHLSAVHPFIEAPDLVVSDPSRLTGPVLTAINVGARHGVLGEAIPVERSEAFLSSLADMTVKVTDQDGEQLASAQGSAVLGHPLNSVLWLRDSGVMLKEGDLVSVGSIGPLLQPEPGLTATVTYVGLPGDPALTLGFE